MAKKIVKPNVTRGNIFDKLGECFGDSTLGMYDGKLRFEIITDDGEVVQFSLAPVIHKTLVEAEECDELVPIADQMEIYNAASAEKDKESQAKKLAAAAKKEKDKDKKAPAKKAGEPTDTVAESVKAPAIKTPVIKVTVDEQKKLDELAKILEGNSF